MAFGNWDYSSDYYYPNEMNPETLFAEENDQPLSAAEDVLAVLLQDYYGSENADYVDAVVVEVVGAADDVVCVVRAHIVPRVDEMRPARTEETDALFEPAYHVGVFAVPAYYFFRPLEVYDVIRRV